MNSLTLKWGTVKEWFVDDGPANDALQKWANHGPPVSEMPHEDTPEQKEALLEVIDQMVEIWLDWDGGRQLTREEAKEYVRNYGTEAS